MHQRKPTLNDMFDYIATLYPERIAIRDKAESISYKELFNRANKIANYLVSMLSGSEHEKNRTPIAIYLPSSIDFVCAKLAILKAGYPYLPLDLKYPADRIQAILQQTHTAIILTTTIQSNAFPEGNWELLTLDVPELFASYSSEIPTPQNKPEDLAYIIFTSGSTGIPKGASIRHENVLNAVYWTHDFFSMQPGEIGAQLTRVVFDASVWEFWANLLIGNTIVIVPEHMMLDPLELRKAIVNDAIEYIFLPTPIGEMIIQEELLPGSKLKWAWVGGDRLLQRPIPKFSAKVANIYGPTECTIVSTCEIVEPDVSTDPPPIGDPIAKAEIYILDENLKVLPPNTKGEICIAGAGVGSGYYNAPQLSNPVFIPNPFSDKAGDILYRSGDLGIYNSNGKLECLGRIDYQVKIRGYRIELGEIEAVLNSLPEIQNVIVLAEGDSNEKELIAFYTTNNSVAMPDSELQAIAEAKLPDYMIPHTYIFISEFPLTANGKIDRRALVRILIPKESQQIGELPTTDFEQSIAGIWSQVLKTSSISLSDRFYQLGGHSIKAAQMIGIIRTKLNLEISIGSLLSNPSLKEFCATISLLKPTDKTTIPVHEKKDAYPLAFDQQGLWYYWRLQPKRRDYIVCMRFDLLGFVNPEILKSAIEFLQERHPIMRCGFRTVQGKPEQYFRDTQELSFTFIKLKQPDKIEKNAASGDSEPVFEHQQLFPYPYETEELLAIENSMRLTPFNLDKDPLYRIALVQFDEQHFCMFLSIHHIITDGWSVGLWQKELRQVYTALLSGKQPNLSPVGITYGDYTLWQLAEKPAQRYPEQQQYWKQRLTPLPTPVQLPLRLTPISEEFPAGKRVWWKLNKQLSQQLRDISQKSGNSLFATMLCLFKVLVLQYNGQEDSTILSIYAGRNLPQTKNLLGLLTNLFFVRSSLNSDNSLSTQIALENCYCAEAMQNIDYPFEQLL
ncbi:MAG: amino acid adenylation domain-containing protein, partial [Candidatus Cloacimonetes bacterium]|nr:amino acid adenylation domain-containing protein [Candidatus Cloacimonadota bacterium]